MPDISHLIKQEIIRLSRKEVKKEVDPLRKTTAGYRRDIAQLKRQLADVTRKLSMLQKTANKAQAQAPIQDDRPIRFVAKGLRSMRARLGLSAAQLGQLLGVSEQSIYMWEQKKSVPRPKTVEAIAALRGLGKREAHARLAA